MYFKKPGISLAYTIKLYLIDINTARPLYMLHYHLEVELVEWSLLTISAKKSEL